MDDASMTAKVSAFARAYHSEHNATKVFDDSLAHALLGDDAYKSIAANMSQGIRYFNPGFEGTPDEALRWVVDNQLSQTVLERSAFAEGLMQQAVVSGVTQYLIFGAGYDTFAYRRPSWAESLEVFELDRKTMAAEKHRHLTAARLSVSVHTHLVAIDLTSPQWPQGLSANAAYDQSARSFCSLLGLVYYLAADDFSAMLDALTSLLAPESLIVFDYPSRQASDEGKRQEDLAQGACEQMQANYSAYEMESLLEQTGMEVVEHLVPEDITTRFFADYNRANPEHTMVAFPNVNLCCAQVV